jgi:hypothetical protein
VGGFENSPGGARLAELLCSRNMSEPGLRIPKIQMAVELAVVGLKPREVAVFIAEHLADRYRPQHLRDLLEGPEHFLPIQEADQTWSIINKATILWAAVNLGEGQLPVEETNPSLQEELFDHRIAVEVELASGPLSGDLLFSPPPGRGRVADHLNEMGRFFRLWTSSRLYLINKSHVLRVRESEEVQ